MDGADPQAALQISLDHGFDARFNLEAYGCTVN